MHETIQEWLTVHFNEPEKGWDIKASFQTRLFDAFKAATVKDAAGKAVFLTDKDTLKDFYKDGCAILDYLIEYHAYFFPTTNRVLVGVEVPLDVPLNPALKFVGYLDIVIRDTETGKIFIYDLKTSKKGWDYEKRDPKKIHQLLLYKSFYSEQFGVSADDIHVEFLILKRKPKKTIRVEGFVPPVSLQTARSRFDEFVSTSFDSDGTVKTAHLVANPSKNNCRFCHFNQRPDLCSASYYHISKQSTEKGH